MATRRRRRRTNRQLDQIGLDIINDAVRRLVLRAFQAITSSTPVDTGFARSGWIPSVGAPNPGPEVDPTGGSRAQNDAIFARNSKTASSLGRTYRTEDGSAFIVNNVRYIGRLNEGHSGQAPRMFVERSIETAIAQTRRDLRS